MTDPEEIADRIKQDLQKVSCMSSVEYVNAVYSTLDRIQDETPGGCFHTYDVSVRIPSIEEEVIREVHEEPNDTLELEISLQTKQPLQFAICTLVINRDWT